MNFSLDFPLILLGAVLVIMAWSLVMFDKAQKYAVTNVARDSIHASMNKWGYASIVALAVTFVAPSFLPPVIVIGIGMLMAPVYFIVSLMLTSSARIDAMITR